MKDGIVPAKAAEMKEACRDKAKAKKAEKKAAAAAAATATAAAAAVLSSVPAATAERSAMTATYRVELGERTDLGDFVIMQITVLAVLVLAWASFRFLRPSRGQPRKTSTATQTETAGFWLTTKNAAVQTPTPKVKSKRSVTTQAQTTYTYKRATPRFVPLAEAGHGVWEEARSWHP